jgi:hypothetical protein
MSGEMIEDTIAQSRLRRAIAELDQDQRAELLDGLLEQLGSEHELPDAVSDRLLDGLIAGKRSEKEILGPDGVLGELTRRLVQRALGEELSEHLGYPAGQAPPGGAGNSRNGGTPKTLLTDHGPVAIDTPRDRKSRFDPQLVRKGQRRLAGIDDKIVALYAGGMTTREIETYMADLYGPGVSRETVSARHRLGAGGRQSLAEQAAGGDLPDPVSRRAGGQDPRRQRDPQHGLLPGDRRQPRGRT